MGRLNANIIQENGLTRREERIFHFFERIGYTSFSQVCGEAAKAYPKLDINTALEVLFTTRKAEVKSAQSEATTFTKGELNSTAKSLLSLQASI